MDPWTWAATGTTALCLGPYPTAACPEIHVGCRLGRELLSMPTYLHDYIFVFSLCFVCVHGAMDCCQKKSYASVAVPLLPGSQRPLPRVSRQSRLSANDKGYNDMIPGVVHRSPGICLKLRKSSENLSNRPSDEGAVRSVIGSNKVPYLQRTSVGSHSTSGNEKEGYKEKTVLLFTYSLFYYSI